MDILHDILPFGDWKVGDGLTNFPGPPVVEDEEEGPVTFLDLEQLRLPEEVSNCPNASLREREPALGVLIAREMPLEGIVARRDFQQIAVGFRNEGKNCSIIHSCE